MEKETVALTWIWLGLKDLYFAFMIDSRLHRPYEIFFEIMAFEKILKAFLLPSNSVLYVSL